MCVCVCVETDVDVSTPVSLWYSRTPELWAMLVYRDTVEDWRDSAS